MIDAKVRDPVSCIPSWLRRHAAPQTQSRDESMPTGLRDTPAPTDAAARGPGLSSSADYGRGGPSAQTSTGHGRRTSCSAARTGTGSGRRPSGLSRWLPGSRHVRDQHSGLVNAELRVLDTPAESHTLREGPTAVDPHVGRVEHRFGGWVAPIRFIQTTSVGASIDCLISMVGAQGLEPWTR